MSLNEESAVDFLERLKAVLEHGPQGQDTALRGLLEELSAHRKGPKKDTLEKAFEIFGTAVGKQSKSAQCGKAVDSSLTYHV
jgi:hypothetical protein